MQTVIYSSLFVIVIFCGLLASLRIGWHVGRRRYEALGEDGNAGLGTLDSAIIALMGLLIAFTFTGAASRFDSRRELITQEINAIGTSWLRLDLLGEKERAQSRELFRRYMDTQIEIIGHPTDAEAIQAGLVKLSSVQQELWDVLILATKNDKSTPLAQTLLPPVNEMFDLTSSRLMAAKQHPPLAVFIMLGALVLVSGLLAGFGMAKSSKQSPIHLYSFAAVMALSVYLTLDLEYPRLGFVRIDSFDEAFIELRATMD